MDLDLLRRGPQRRGRVTVVRDVTSRQRAKGALLAEKVMQERTETVGDLMTITGVPVFVFGFTPLIDPDTAEEYWVK